MNALVENLPEAQRDSLLGEFQRVEPLAWVIDIAHRQDWRHANEAYLAHELHRGREEMRHLMAALGVRPPLTAEQAADLVEAALRLYVGTAASPEAVRRTAPASIRVRVCDCPTYRRLEATHWLGVTACGAWHRRRGWYEALGVFPSDSVVAESKWGDEACEAVIEFVAASA